MKSDAGRTEQIVKWLRDQGLQENRNVDKATARSTDVRYHQGRAGAFFLAAAAINSGVHLQAAALREAGDDVANAAKTDPPVTQADTEAPKE